MTDGYKISKIYVGTNQVRPEKKREPGANTVAYWRFEENLEDSSGRHEDLVSGSSPYEYITGVSGYAVHKLSRSATFYRGGFTDTVFSGNFTLMFFIEFDELSSLVDRIMGCGSNWTNIQYEPGNGGLQRYNNGEAGRTKWSWTPSANTWYHIAITGDGTAYTAYLDGETMSKLKQGTVAQGGETLAIGNNGINATTSSGNSQGFLGALDEVIIEDKIWTQAEIQSYLSDFTY